SGCAVPVSFGSINVSERSFSGDFFGSTGDDSLESNLSIALAGFPCRTSAYSGGDFLVSTGEECLESSLSSSFVLKMFEWSGCAVPVSFGSINLSGCSFSGDFFVSTSDDSLESSLSSALAGFPWRTSAYSVGKPSAVSTSINFSGRSFLKNCFGFTGDECLESSLSSGFILKMLEWSSCAASVNVISINLSGRSFSGDVFGSTVNDSLESSLSSALAGFSWRTCAYSGGKASVVSTPINIPGRSFSGDFFVSIGDESLESRDVFGSTVDDSLESSLSNALAGFAWRTTACSGGKASAVSTAINFSGCSFSGGFCGSTGDESFESNLSIGFVLGIFEWSGCAASVSLGSINIFGCFFSGDVFGSTDDESLESILPSVFVLGMFGWSGCAASVSFASNNISGCSFSGDFFGSTLDDNLESRLSSALASSPWRTSAYSDSKASVVPTPTNFSGCSFSGDFFVSTGNERLESSFSIGLAGFSTTSSAWSVGVFVGFTGDEILESSFSSGLADFPTATSSSLVAVFVGFTGDESLESSFSSGLVGFSTATSARSVDKAAIVSTPINLSGRSFSADFLGFAGDQFSLALLAMKVWHQVFQVVWLVFLRQRLQEDFCGSKGDESLASSLSNGLAGFPTATSARSVGEAAIVSTPINLPFRSSLRDSFDCTGNVNLESVDFCGFTGDESLESSLSNGSSNFPMTKSASSVKDFCGSIGDESLESSLSSGLSGFPTTTSAWSASKAAVVSTPINLSGCPFSGDFFGFAHGESLEDSFGSTGDVNLESESFCGSTGGESLASSLSTALFGFPTITFAWSVRDFFCSTGDESLSSLSSGFVLRTSKWSGCEASVVSTPINLSECFFSGDFFDCTGDEILESSLSSDMGSWPSDRTSTDFETLCRSAPLSLKSSRDCFGDINSESGLSENFLGLDSNTSLSFVDKIPVNFVSINSLICVIWVASGIGTTSSIFSIFFACVSRASVGDNLIISVGGSLGVNRINSTSTALKICSSSIGRLTSRFLDSRERTANGKASKLVLTFSFSPCAKCLTVVCFCGEAVDKFAPSPTLLIFCNSSSSSILRLTPPELIISSKY
uniref:Uncharacterized protein n=1 Tax=Glossina austeni TaxID=7395 RepID=A0A1A9UPF6_GLOAU